MRHGLPDHSPARHHADRLASADGSTGRYHQGPGQLDLVRLVDVDGELLIVDVMWWPELPASERDEFEALLASMTFELAQP